MCRGLLITVLQNSVLCILMYEPVFANTEHFVANVNLISGVFCQ